MSANHIEREVFSSADAALWHMYTSTNLAIIVGVIFFENQFNLEALKGLIETRLLRYKRFSQRVHESSIPLRLPRWEIDSNFDINYHVRRTQFSTPIGHDELQKLVGAYMSTPLDKTKPLWRFHLLEDFTEGSALIFRLHHCMSDGLSLVQILFSISDEEFRNLEDETSSDVNQELSGLARMLLPGVKTVLSIRDTWRRGEKLVQKGFESLIYPYQRNKALSLGKKSIIAMGKIASMPFDSKPVFQGECGIQKLAVWSDPLDLEDFCELSKKLHGTINDILLTMLTGALRRYLVSKGELVDGTNLRVTIPFSLRPQGDLYEMGNRFGSLFLNLPIGEKDPQSRFLSLKNRVDNLKNTPEPILVFESLSLLGYTPPQIEKLILGLLGSRGTTVVTNVPGPTIPLHLGGNKIYQIMAWVPTPVNLSLGVSMISYNGKVYIGIVTDAGIVPDPENIITEIYNELDQMKQWNTNELQSLKEINAEKTIGLIQDKIDKDESKSIISHENEGNAGKVKFCQAVTKTGRPCKNRVRYGISTCYIHRNQVF